LKDSYPTKLPEFDEIAYSLKKRGGIINSGNTCFFSSAIQALYSMEMVRNDIMNINSEPLSYISQCFRILDKSNSAVNLETQYKALYNIMKLRLRGQDDAADAYLRMFDMIGDLKFTDIYNKLTINTNKQDEIIIAFILIRPGVKSIQDSVIYNQAFSDLDYYIGNNNNYICFDRNETSVNSIDRIICLSNGYDNEFVYYILQGAIMGGIHGFKHYFYVDIKIDNNGKFIESYIYNDQSSYQYNEKDFNNNIPLIKLLVYRRIQKKK
jgi:hypothetical protein